VSEHAWRGCSCGVACIWKFACEWCFCALCLSVCVCVCVCQWLGEKREIKENKAIEGNLRRGTLRHFAYGAGVTVLGGRGLRHIPAYQYGGGLRQRLKVGSRRYIKGVHGVN
jgi:hypothetical protein